MPIRAQRLVWTGALGFWVAGCPTSDPAPKDQPVVVAKSEDAGGDASPKVPKIAPPEHEITFAEDIAPILYEHCADCHHEGGPAPFSLVTYADAKKHGRQIVEVAMTEYMPPWLPAEGFGAFEGERRLMHRHKKALAGWVAGGFKEGPLEKAPKPPTFTSGWQLGKPDLELEAAEAFEVPADGKDVYRNFVVRVPSGAPRFVKTVELLPGPPQVVHHAVMRVDSSGSAARLDAEDETPGFDGMTFAGARMPGGRFIGWTPGKAPDPGSADRSWQLVGDTDLVVQVHLRPTGKVEQVRPKIGLHFTDAPPTKVALAMELSSTEIDIPPGTTDYGVTDTFTLPADVNVLRVYPHAHYLGKQLEGFATLPDGNKRWLIKIDNWDFDWQDEYRFMKPVALPKGSVITMNYTYDNSEANPRNPNTPPKQVKFGPNSDDEMAELILEIEPAKPQDLQLLDQAFMSKWLDGQLTAARKQLAENPEDPKKLANLAALLARGGKQDEAKEQYEASLAAGDDATTRVDYAILLMQGEDYDGAKAQVDAALELAPEDARVHLTLGNILRLTDDPKAAVKAYEAALRLAPDLVDAHNNLGVTFEKLDKPKKAAAAFAKAVELAPGQPKFRENAGRALEAARDYDGAIAAYRAALERNPQSVRGMRGLGYLLAAHPKAEARNVEEAIGFADAAGKATGFRSPEVMEAMAVSVAAAGRFDDANKAIERAITLAEAAKREDLVARYKALAELFAAKKPFVLPKR